MNVHIHDFLPESETMVWDLWYPEAGATGVPFARGRLNPTEVLWVHAAPPTLEVTVRAGNGQVIARGESLTRSGKRDDLAIASTDRHLQRWGGSMYPEHLGWVEPSTGKRHSGRACFGIPEVPQHCLTLWQKVVDMDVHRFSSLNMYAYDLQEYLAIELSVE